MIKSANTSSTSKIGLALSLVGYLIVSAILNISPLKEAFTSDTVTILGFLSAWLLAGILVFIVIRVERRALATIGLKTISLKEALVALVLGIVLSLTVPVLTLIVGQIIPSPEEGSISSVTENVPALLLLFSVLTAGVTEEILYRGYLIERIIEITGKKWLALIISVIAFVLPHIFGWNWTHLIAVVLPFGVILSGLYIWKRNLIFNMIIHIMIDLPLVFISFLSNQN